MKRSVRGTVRFAVTVAIFGFVLMVFYLATGDGSPEPTRYPAWPMAPRDVAGKVFFLIVTLLCLPSLMIAALVVKDLGLWFWSFELWCWAIGCWPRW